MYGRKVKLRFFFVFLIIITLSLTVFLILKSLEENVIYFKSPSEVKVLSEKQQKKIRIGGMVKKGSILVNRDEIKFIITDLKNEIIVSYKGSVPNLFAEGKGVIAEGNLSDKKFFVAKRILAKHDENYMPPEIKKTLDKNAE